MKHSPEGLFRLIQAAGGHGDGGVIGVFAFYVDDSDADGGQVATLGGYIGSLDGWSEYEEKSQTVYERFEVDYLHTKNLMGTKAAFAGWSTFKKQAFIADLFEIAKAGVLHGASASVTKGFLKDFRRLASQSQSARFRKTASMSRYGLAFEAMIGSVMNWKHADRIRQEGLSIIVETGSANNGEIEQSFHRMSAESTYSHVLRSITFVNKKSCRAIQLADFNAMSSRRIQALANRLPGVHLPIPAVYYAATSRVPHLFALLNGKPVFNERGHIAFKFKTSWADPSEEVR